jgi:deleted-in-malignant-brain-tumors protein 1
MPSLERDRTVRQPQPLDEAPPLPAPPVETPPDLLLAPLDPLAPPAPVPLPPPVPKPPAPLAPLSRAPASVGGSAPPIGEVDTTTSSNHNVSASDLLCRRRQ